MSIERNLSAEAANGGGGGGDESPKCSASQVGRKGENRMRNEWTNERHSSYLNSMEESFVRQLHSHEYFSTMLDFLSKRPKFVDHNEKQSTGKSASCINQFKVLQEGCWQKRNFDSARAHDNDLQALKNNPWFQRFRTDSIVRGRSKTASKSSDNALLLIEENYAKAPLGDKASGETLGRSRRLRNFSSDMLLQRAVGSNTEVSDQNFCEEVEEEGLVDTTKTKRRKIATRDLPSIDQVVP